VKFENTFSVPAPAQEVWGTLMDVERIAPCMPGAQVLERLGDDAYKVGVRVKLGPISMQYRGQLAIVERDDGDRHATMHAKAKEARGQGTADATIRMRLAEQDGGSLARIETDLALSGKAAAMGQGVIGDVAARLVAEFAANLQQLLAAEPGTAPQAAAAEPDRPASAATPASEPAPAGATAPGPPPEAAPASSTALPVGRIAAGVIAGRLSDPRTLLMAIATLAAVFTAIGYRIGRSRRSAR
jgi:carbon monoxide dehydrogenase subunit G